MSVKQGGVKQLQMLKVNRNDKNCKGENNFGEHYKVF